LGVVSNNKGGEDKEIVAMIAKLVSIQGGNLVEALGC